MTRRDRSAPARPLSVVLAVAGSGLSVLDDVVLRFVTATSEQVEESNDFSNDRPSW